MNKNHLEFLASAQWAAMLEADLLPWLVSVVELGGDVLEIGPGPGLTTDMLRQRTSKLTAVEADKGLATALAARLRGTNVDVLHADGTDTGLAASRFSVATCFSMLHHMPSAALQDRLFAEMFRVLRSGGTLVGTDSIDSRAARAFHEDDVFVPVDPRTLGTRLEAVGFVDAGVEVASYEIRFRARKP